MDPVRVIPCLNVKDGRVTSRGRFVRDGRPPRNVRAAKGVIVAGVSEARDVRDITETVLDYVEQGADEFVMFDVAAALERRGTKLDWAKEVVEAASVPVTVGGGVGALKEIEALLELGAAKAALGSAAVRNPAMVEEAADEFGPERIVVAIDGELDEDADHGAGRLEVLVVGDTTRSGRAGLEVVEWARRMSDSGAGEILLTSKDADGTKAGFDIPMTRAVADAVPVPVVASGGAGAPEHFSEAVAEGHAAAVLAASVFHFRDLTVLRVKEHLKERGIAVGL